MKNLLLLACALFVLACGQPAETNTDDLPNVDTPMTTDEATRMNDADMNGMGSDATLQATIDAVQANGGDVTALPPATAVSNIDSWIGKLQNMDGTGSIVNNLQLLKTELTAGNIDGTRVSQLLSSLAAETRELGQDNPGLNTLAGALEAGAMKLDGR